MLHTLWGDCMSMVQVQLSKNYSGTQTKFDPTIVQTHRPDHEQHIACPWNAVVLTTQPLYALPQTTM